MSTLDALLRRLPVARKDSGTGIFGVRWRADVRRYHVRIGGRSRGYFASLTKAVRAAVNAHEGNR